MAGPFFQIVITLWLGAHPVTYTLPKIYGPRQRCFERIDELAKRVKPHRHLEMQCVTTDKRDI